MEMLSASAIMAYVPKMEVAFPILGNYDFAPIVTALAIFSLLTLFFAAIRHIVIVRLERLSRKTHTDYDDVVIDAIRGIRPWAYSIVALFVALQFFSLPSWLELTAKAIFFFTVIWQAIEVALKFVRFGTERFLKKDEDGDGQTDPGSATASHMVVLIARIVLWALGGLFVLSNLGIEITSLIAGLGIGGVAVAFALQGILSDLFASFSIYFDKPFRIGDFVAVGDDYGTVEKIGIKSTRLRALSGEELVLSNAELTSARVQNYKKMQVRRNVVKFGILYETPYEKVKAVPQMIEDILKDFENLNIEYAKFVGFGDSALLFETAYNVQSPDYNTHLDVQQKFSFALMDKFKEEGIEFAYPTQTLYVKKD